MKAYLICWGVAIIFLAMFYIWGKSFLSIICANADMSSSILFGFLIVLLSYQIPYLPVFLCRGSYRNLSWCWFAVTGIVTILLLIRLCKNHEVTIEKASKTELISITLVSAVIIFICSFISLHPPAAYGQDTNTYISAMNEMRYEDRIWISWDNPAIHHGLTSLFGFMTVPSLIINIRPYFCNLFTMRILLVLLTALSMYRIGKIAFSEAEQKISLKGLWLSVLVLMLFMFWNSDYQAHFFFRRSNEAKAFCQFVLFPLAFSVFLQMLQKSKQRKSLWIEQILIGFSAVAVSMSSLSGYPFLVLLGTIAILVNDHFKRFIQTIILGILCIIPNIIYLLILLRGKGIIRF